MDVTELELQSPEAERGLIGAAAYYPDAAATVLADLPGSDFYDPHRGTVWDAFRALVAEHAPLTPIAVMKHLAAAGKVGLAIERVVTTDMANAYPVSHARHLAEEVSDLARRRELLRAITRARQIATTYTGSTSDVLAAVRGALAEVGEPDRPSADRDGPLGWDALIDEFEQVHAPGGARPGIPSPWWELDQILGGLFGGRVYVWGGRPGAGKSTAALIVAMHAAAESNRQALVISKEMPRVDVTGRILARGAEVPLTEINSRTVSDHSMARIRDYVKRVGTPPITVDAKPRSLGGIKSLARAHHHRHGLDVLVVDYLQLVRTDSPSRSREQEVAEVSRQLKELALELDCVVCLPAQLNRESGKRADPRPTMSDLRDSGQIEQDADAIVLLHRPLTPDGLPTGQIQFIVDKNRHGPTAEISLRWQGGYGAIG
jgi:replicative DNA helicase